MRRRTFIHQLTAGVSAFALGAHKLLGDESIYGVPLPPGPPKPPQPTSVVPVANPPYAHEIPTIPFDAPPGSWTLLSLPDTQSMSARLAAEYARQTDWIVAHRERHNIRFVVHEGDLVNNAGARDQWVNAQNAMRTLTKAGIPYSLLPGNHDLGLISLASDRTTLLNEYFSAEDYRHSEAMGFFEPRKMENSWHHFTAPSGNYLVVSLEYWPRNAVVAWADEIIRGAPDRKVILVTHAYLDHMSGRFDWTERVRRGLVVIHEGLALYGDVNDGEDLWKKIVRRNANVFLVICGHEIATGTGYLMSEGEHGQRVHQVLANYQLEVEPQRPYYGGGYLRLMQFHPDGIVNVKTYSPWLNQWLTTTDQQFSFTV